MRWPRAIEALSEPAFRTLFSAHAVSLLGDGIARVALVFAVLEVSDSPAAVGLVLAAQSVPLVLFLLVGGVVGDRRQRRLIMVTADLVRGSAQLVMAVLLVSGAAEVWHLAALAATHGAATAFFNPASEALLPQMVTAPRLRQANTLRGMAQAAGSVVGPAIAGVLVALTGAGWALGLDAVTFLISALLLLRLPALPRAARTGRSIGTDLREGWREFIARDWVWGIVVGAAVGNAVMGALWVLGPVIADESLGGPAVWGLMVSALGAGSLIGGIGLLRVEPARPLVVAVAAVALPVLPMTLVAGAAPATVIALGMLLAGAGLMIFNTLWDTTLQRHVPAESLSRVSSYDWFGSLALDPVGRGLAGPVAVAIGTSTTLWAAAGLYAAVVIGELSIPGVRRMRSHPPQPVAANG